MFVRNDKAKRKAEYKLQVFQYKDKQKGKTRIRKVKKLRT